QAAAGPLYQDFVRHFEHSPAHLPQIAEARARATLVRLSKPGKLLFNADFSGTAPAPGWSHRLAYHNAIFEFSVRLNGTDTIELILSNKSGRVCHLFLKSDSIGIQTAQPAAQSMAHLDTSSELGKWHTVVVEVDGKRMVAQLDGRYTIGGE